MLCQVVFLYLVVLFYGKILGAKELLGPGTEAHVVLMTSMTFASSVSSAIRAV